MLHHEISEVPAGVKKVVEQEDRALVGHVFAQGCIQPREGYAGRSPTGAGSVGLRLAALSLVLVLWCRQFLIPWIGQTGRPDTAFGNGCGAVNLLPTISRGKTYLQALKGDVVGVAVAFHGSMVQQRQQHQQACLAEWTLRQLLIARADQECDGLDGQPQHGGCKHRLTSLQKCSFSFLPVG